MIFSRLKNFLSGLQMGVDKPGAMSSPPWTVTSEPAEIPDILARIGHA